MSEMFGLLKELTSSRTPEKSIEGNKVVDKNIIEPNKLDAVEPLDSVDRKEEMKDRTDDASARSMKKELTGWEIKGKVLVETPRILP
ncbi:hypothetical protein Tco_0988913 [Tanacetum coccineum]|uniref:Uncharacterized protein n=1 Tax=Tanacetum coccineum TaxID=301880 RepID=A0ABQ5ESM4_9ASTR